MYGMGWSSSPSNVKYNEKLFVSQLAEVLYGLNVTETFILVGHSMGGGMVGE
jgi:pimeloyl-ACP methyl ester carboxylesterase